MKKLAFSALLALGCLASVQAAPITNYTAVLDGPSESPPNASPGTGFATFQLDSGLHTLLINLSFSGLVGTTLAAHIHAATAAPGTGTAGVATQTPSFTNFPLGVTSGSMSQTLDLTLLSSYSAPFVSANGGTAAGAEAALVAAMDSGRAYINIHSNVFPGGEIRGFIAQASSVPEINGSAWLLPGAFACFFLLATSAKKPGRSFQI